MRRPADRGGPGTSRRRSADSSRARHAARRFADLAALGAHRCRDRADRDGIVREVQPHPVRAARRRPRAAAWGSGRRPVRRPRARSGRDRAGGTAAPAAARLAAPGGAGRGAPLLGGRRATAARGPDDRVVRAGGLDEATAGRRRLVLAVRLHRRQRAAPRGGAAAQRQGTVDELHPAAQPRSLPGAPARPARPAQLRNRVAVICGDLDDFRRVNSALGHEAGDDLLVTLAGRLQRELPVGCTAARLGADEFVVVDAGNSPTRAATRPSPRSSRACCAPRARCGTGAAPASVGVDDAAGGPGTSPRPTCCASPRRCRNAKRYQPWRCRAGDRRGRRLRDARPGAGGRAAGRDRREHAGAGVPAGRGPRTASSAPRRRWCIGRTRSAAIPPCEFLPIAQRGGLLRELDDWVLRTACREAADWPEHGGRPVAVTTWHCFRRSGVPGHRDRRGRVRGPPGTGWCARSRRDQPASPCPHRPAAAMERLVQRGVRFAIDDSGTGYSSLARLKELPAQIVEVDRAFVGVASGPRGLRGRAGGRGHGEGDGALDRGGRRDGAEHHVLRGVGVDAQQGWLFARSLPPRQLRRVARGRAGRGAGGSERVTSPRQRPGGNDTVMRVPGTADRVSLAGSRRPARRRR